MSVLAEYGTVTAVVIYEFEGSQPAAVVEGKVTVLRNREVTER
jgi:hypothetical protein